MWNRVETGIHYSYCIKKSLQIKEPGIKDS